MGIVNPELFSLAQRAISSGRSPLEKVAVVPPGMQDPAAMGAVPPVAPGQMPPDPAAGGDPAAAAAPPPAAPATPPGMTDPSMMGGLPPAQPQPAAQPGQQKIKPEQMMQMLDYRLYNMQQQLTAIMNAMGVQVAPESLVLPPGTTGAPPAETALPGGPMAPPPQDPAAAQGGGGGPQPPGGPLPPGGPMDPSAPPVDPSKQANWWDAIDEYSASRIGTPISKDLQSVDEPISLQMKAAAVSALHRNRVENAH
jgi:hypothetical protein